MILRKLEGTRYYYAKVGPLGHNTSEYKEEPHCSCGREGCPFAIKGTFYTYFIIHIYRRQSYASYVRSIALMYDEDKGTYVVQGHTTREWIGLKNLKELSTINKCLDFIKQHIER